MAGKQTTGLAYGRPDYGGLVLGKSHAGAFELGDDWDTLEDGENVIVTASVTVYGETAEQLESRVQALKALRQREGNLSIMGPDFRTVSSLTLTVSSRDIILSSTTSQFASTDVGKIFDIAGYGPVQCSEFGSAMQITCRIPEPLGMPTPGSDVTATVGRTIQRIVDAERLVGFNCVAKVAHRGNDPDNTATRLSFALTFTFRAPASDVRGEDVDRIKARIMVSEPPGGERTALFVGEITAAESQTAYARYDAQIPAWITSNMASILGGASWGKSREPDQLEWDDRNNILRFRLKRSEILTNEALGQVDHPALADANIQFDRKRIQSSGLEGQFPMEAFELQYDVMIVRGQPADGDLDNLFNTVIYPNLINLIQSFSSSSVIVDQVRPRYNPKTRLLTVMIQGMLPDTGSSITAYTRQVSYRLKKRKTYRDLWDGAPLSAIRSSPGPVIEAVVTVSWVEITDVAAGRSPQSVGFGLGGQPLGLSSDQGALGLEADVLQVTLGNGEGGEPVTFDPLAAPTPAPDFFANFGVPVDPGEWDDGGLVIEPTVRHRGNDPTGLSATARERQTVASRVWRWIDLKGTNPRGGLQAPTVNESLPIPNPSTDTVSR